jgi:hypothetical protein
LTQISEFSLSRPQKSTTYLLLSLLYPLILKIYINGPNIEFIEKGFLNIKQKAIQMPNKGSQETLYAIHKNME